MKNKLINCRIEFADGAVEEFSSNVALPFSVCFSLDETLDTSKLVLTGLRKERYRADVSKAFEPFSVVILNFEGQVKDIRMIINSDHVERVRKDNYSTYKHTISLIEETKKIERILVDTLMFSNKVERVYKSDKDVEWTAVFSGGINSKNKYSNYTPPTFPQVVNEEEVIFSDNMSLIKGEQFATIFTRISKFNITITNPLNKKTIFKSNVSGSVEGTTISYDSNVYTYKTKVVGEYSIDIDINMYDNSINTTYTAHYFTSFVVNADEAIKPYTLADTINRTLEVTPLRLEGEEQKYKFNSEQLEEMSAMESPEFSFSGHTLFEAMLMIAQYRGMFPFLKGDEISFRKMWNGKVINYDDLPKAYDIQKDRSLDQYCTHLDSTVQNIVGINNSMEGTVTEPYVGGYKTPRSMSGSSINEESAYVPTKYPVYDVISLEMGKIGESLTEVGDITPYVFEADEYEAMSDTSGSYPYSKAYALRFTHMGEGIYELAHKIQTSSEVAAALTRTALSNIVYVQTDETVGVNLLTYMESLIGHENKKSFADLPFRSQYIPVVTARVKTYKDCLEDFNCEGGLIYNQGAEVVDSEMLGQHLKSTVAKMGNDTFASLHQFNTVDEVPEIGTIVITEDRKRYSLYGVSMLIYENRVLATLSFVQYAELCSYIGVKSEWRYSDVSTKKYCERAVNYDEFCVLSSVKYTDNDSHFSTQALNYATEYTSGGKQVSAVRATGYTAEGEALNTVILPVVAFGFGNSLYWHWSYENNASAGKMSISAPDGATTTLTGTKYDRAQKDVKYADIYGRIETYDFSLLETGPIPKVNTDTWQFNVNEFFASAADGVLTVTSDTAYDFDITIDTAGGTLVLSAGETSATLTTVLDDSDGVEVTAAYADLSSEQAQAWAVKQIGYSLPLLPDEVKSGFSANELMSVKGEILKKNAGEAIHHSVQLHFLSDDPDTVIGSGLASFSSIMGNGSNAVRVYGFNGYLNKFDRHLNIAQGRYLGSPIKYVDGNGKCVYFTLPSGINDGYLSYAVLGKDNNGNWQIIFGANKKPEEDFETVMYFNFRRDIYNHYLFAYFSETPLLADYPYPSRVVTDVATATFSNKLLISEYPRNAIVDGEVVVATFDSKVIMKDYPYSSAPQEAVEATFSDEIKLESYPNVSEQKEVALATFNGDSALVVNGNTAIQKDVATATFISKIIVDNYPNVSSVVTVHTVKLVNGYTAQTIATLKLIDGQSLKLSEYTPSTPTGYRALGWYVSDSYVSDGYAPTGDCTITYKFEILTYTVKYYNYDGTLLYTATVNYGGYATYGGATPTRAQSGATVYTFSGWSTDLTNTPITANTSVTAQYTSSTQYFTLTFVNSLAGTTTTKTVEAYTTTTLPQLPSIDGYIAKYWNSGGVNYQAGSSYYVSGNTSFGAVYNAIVYHSVTFKVWLWDGVSTNSAGLEGSVYSTTQTTVREDLPLSSFFSSTPSASGYVFYEYQFASTVNGAYPSGTKADLSLYPTDDSIVLYAVARKTYTVTFKYLDGTIVTKSGVYGGITAPSTSSSGTIWKVYVNGSLVQTLTPSGGTVYVTADATAQETKQT